jgi:hypothetical protein
VSHRLRCRAALLALFLPLTALVGLSGPSTAQAAPPSSAVPDLGDHTLVFDPSMSVAEITAKVDAVAAQQVGNQFGPERWALLFEPGTMALPPSR